ncbi:MAG: hypothetical protein LBS71_01130, partial [Puniceicoccales bacterium]|nr:hypothetical protein [Puniceicoccales bacterium]
YGISGLRFDANDLGQNPIPWLSIAGLTKELRIFYIGNGNNGHYGVMVPKPESGESPVKRITYQYYEADGTAHQVVFEANRQDPVCSW